MIDKFDDYTITLDIIYIYRMQNMKYLIINSYRLYIFNKLYTDYHIAYRRIYLNNCIFLLDYARNCFDK